MGYRYFWYENVELGNQNVESMRNDEFRRTQGFRFSITKERTVKSDYFDSEDTLKHSLSVPPDGNRLFGDGKHCERLQNKLMMDSNRKLTWF